MERLLLERIAILEVEIKTKEENARRFLVIFVKEMKLRLIKLTVES